MSNNFLNKFLKLNIFSFNKNILLKSNKHFCSASAASLLKVNDPENESLRKTVRVAVIGVPNAGKSTFINNLIHHRVCPTSSKVHTTRQSNTAIYTERDTQVLIFDTPGLVTEKEIKKHNLESSFKRAYRHSIQHADVIAVIHDVSNSWTRNHLHHTVLETLTAYPKLPSFLIINKIDLLKSKRILLEMIKKLTNNTLVDQKKFDNLKRFRKNTNTELKPNKQEIVQKDKKPEQIVGWSNFSDVFMVSSLLGDGLNDVMKLILNFGKPNEWKFPADLHTDESPENLIVASVRARLLDYLPQEIPYLLRVEIEHFSMEKNTIYASVVVHCPNARLERLFCGESNGKLKQITERITSDLVETFNKPISLTIITQLKKMMK